MNPLFKQVIQILTGRFVPVGGHKPAPPVRTGLKNHRAYAKPHVAPRSRVGASPSQQHVPASRHAIGLVGYNERAYPIAKLADPHAPWVTERMASLATRPRRGSLTNITHAITLSMEMLERRKDAIREIFLVTDGKANVDVAGLPAAVRSAQNSRVRIHACGMGYGFDGAQLHAIAGPTGGRVIIARDLRAVAMNLRGVGQAVVNQSRGKQSALVVAIDTSGSMDEKVADGRTKLEACAEAVQHLLTWYTSNHA